MPTLANSGKQKKGENPTLVHTAELVSTEVVYVEALDAALAWAIEELMEADVTKRLGARSDGGAL